MSTRGERYGTELPSVQVAAMLGVALILFGFSHRFWWSLGQGLDSFWEHRRATGDGLLHHGIFRRSSVRQSAGGVTVMVTRMFCVAGALWFELPKIRAIMRPIYQEMGLLPAQDLDAI